MSNSSDAATGMNPDFQSKLNQMIAESGGRIKINSGYRSVDEQTKLWNTALAKYGSESAARKWVAPPGKSNHNSGFAADLGGDLDLAHKLASKYGLNFPMGHEPWHVEPGGHRGDKEAYTTPRAHDPKLDNTLQSFQSILMSMGQQGSEVGVQPTTVGDQGSTVGKDSQITTDIATDPTLDSSTAMTPGSQITTGGGGDEVDRFMSAISGQESGGNYNARNAGSGASGKFQIMPANWAPWAKEAGLASGAAMTPENQDRVARFKFQQYKQQFGSWELAAAAWFSGPNNAAKIAKNPGLASKINDGNKNVAEYMQYVKDRMAS